MTRSPAPIRRLAFVLALVVALPAASQEFSVQGVLRSSSGALVADGSYDLTFNLYTVSSGGSATWTEAHTGGSQVAVANGIFATTLGGITSLAGIDFTTAKYLGVTVASDPELSPRITLTAVPMALSVTGTSNAFTSGGNVGVGTTSPTSPGGFSKLLQISGSTLSLILHDTDDAEDWEIALQASGLLEFVNDGTTQMVIDNSGNVGIATTTPTAEIANAQLRVSGAGHVVVDNDYGFVSVNSGGNGIGAGFDTDASDQLLLISNGATRMTLSAAGNASFTGSVTATGFSGSVAGSDVGTGINASNVTNGTLAQARLGSALGSWTVGGYSAGTAYLAGTDLFVLVWNDVSGGQRARVVGYTDSSNPPTTVVAQSATTDASSGTHAFIMIPVRKGDYWKYTLPDGLGTSQASTIPLGN